MTTQKDRSLLDDLRSWVRDHLVPESSIPADAHYSIDLGSRFLSERQVFLLYWHRFEYGWEYGWDVAVVFSTPPEIEPGPFPDPTSLTPLMTAPELVRSLFAAIWRDNREGLKEELNRIQTRKAGPRPCLLGRGWVTALPDGVEDVRGLGLQDFEVWFQKNLERTIPEDLQMMPTFLDISVVVTFPNGTLSRYALFWDKVRSSGSLVVALASDVLFQTPTSFVPFESIPESIRSAFVYYWKHHRDDAIERLRAKSQAPSRSRGPVHV